MKKIIFSFIFFLPMSVFAAVPAFPMSFYGSVAINGVAAPTGTIVRAYYGTALAGQAVVNEAGVYGYNSPTKQQLLVGEGSGAIRFTVQAGVINGGQETEGLVAQTHTSFVSGDAMEKNLVFTFTNPVSSVTPAPATGGGGGGGGGGGSYSSPVAAVQPTSVSVATTTTAVVPSSIIPAAKPAGQVLGAAAFVFSKNLTVGSRGVDITELQKVLVAGGFLTVSPTGYFGPATKAAVIAYQKSHNIAPASGFVGPLTRALLNNTNIPVSQVSAPVTFVFSKNLTVGSTGNDVTELQKVLFKEGFFSITPTLYFGAITKTAVIAYQKSHNIAPASGFVGPLTRAELNK